jgi:hypothetical protein
MNWRVKVIGHWICSCPLIGPPLYRVLQERVVHSVIRADEQFIGYAGLAISHLNALQRNGAHAASGSVFYELGAGWDLIIPLTMWAMGVERQILADVARLARPEVWQKYT